MGVNPSKYWTKFRRAIQVLLLTLKLARFDEPSYTGCWLCVDAELAIGQCRLGVHGTCGLKNPWHHLQKMS